MLASVLIKPNMVTKVRKVPDKMYEQQQGKGTESEERSCGRFVEQDAHA